jgi:hypothetical protein
MKNHLTNIRLCVDMLEYIEPAFKMQEIIDKTSAISLEDSIRVYTSHLRILNIFYLEMLKNRCFRLSHYNVNFLLLLKA